MMANVTKNTEAVESVESDIPEDLLIKAQGMNIKQYVPAVKLGHYDDQVKTLLALNEQTGFDNLIPVLVPTAEIKKHKRWFKESAAVYGKGARVVNGEDGEPQGDGGTLLEFILTERRTVTRKAKDATEEAVPAAA